MSYFCDIVKREIFSGRTCEVKVNRALQVKKKYIPGNLYTHHSQTYLSFEYRAKLLVLRLVIQSTGLSGFPFSIGIKFISSDVHISYSL